jgi:hypothetical protein
MDQPNRMPAVSASQRERIIETLCTHFAADHLSVEEFERRVDVATRSNALPDLHALVSDLPAASVHAPPAAVPAARPGADPDPMAPPRARQFVLSLMGGTERRGAWRPASRIMVFTAMGGTVLDFRDVLMNPGVTEIDIFCVMGGVEIIVPPQLAVEANGFAIMGGWDSSAQTAPYDPARPLLRLNGLAVMGGVEVQVRLPGESAKDAKRRLKAQAKIIQGDDR